MTSLDREEFLASQVEFSLRDADQLITLDDERPAARFPRWILGVAQTAVVAAAFFGTAGQVNQKQVTLRTESAVVQPQHAYDCEVLRSEDLFTRPQATAAVAELMLRAPRLRSVDHLLD